MKKNINSNMILTGLFFHDIMVLLTSYFIKIKEIKYNLVMNDLINERLKSFPYIDYYDILNNLDYSVLYEDIFGCSHEISGSYFFENV